MSTETDAIDDRVLRGGSWNSYAWFTRSARRDWYIPDIPGDDFGFRLILRRCYEHKK